MLCTILYVIKSTQTSFCPEMGEKCTFIFLTLSGVDKIKSKTKKLTSHDIIELVNC